MKKTLQKFVFAAAFSIATMIGSGTAQAQATCQPGLIPAFLAHQAEYTALANTLVPVLVNLDAKLAAMVDQTTYASLLTDARAVANSIATGRLVVTVPDGTVVLDTARPDDPTNVMAVGNSFAHFQSKTVNENHNSRIAFMAAQEYECGVAIEAKFSTSTGQREFYAAARLGAHLDSNGTARLSIRQ